MGKKGRGTVRMGRPPRTDSPVRVGLMLPGELRNWLAARARTEGRSQSDILASGLELYRVRVARRTT
jgi:hypothetical protein